MRGKAIRAFTFSALVLSLSLTSTGAYAETPEETCATNPAALHVIANEDFVGTSGNDIICGTEFDDVIDGGAGDDIIYSFAGDDTITSGDGNDTIDAGDGNDTVDGDSGNDLITLGEGDDYAEGGVGADKLWGGDGADALIGEAGNDWVDAGSGDDEIKLDAGDDYALGGPGADLLLGGTGKDALYAQAGSDSIDGGAGADTVDGGVGAGTDRDYCVKDTSDTQKRCFYDSKAPTLNSIAVVGPKSFDTSDAGATLTLRLNLRDAGSGVTSFNIALSRLNSKGVPIGNMINLGWSVWGPKCTGETVPEPDPLMNQQPGCRIAGDDMNGIYEVKALLPRYLPDGTYLLANAVITDTSGNTAILNYSQLKAKKLAINFKQTAAGDDAAPVLRSISILDKSVNTSSGPQTVRMRFAASDSLSGLKYLSLMFSYQTKSVTNMQNVLISWYNPGRDESVPLPLCSDAQSSSPMGMFQATTCVVSGTANSAVIEATATLPAFSAQGTYLLTGVSGYDFAGNQRWYGPDTLKKLKMAVSFKQTGSGDAIGPTLKDIKVLTPTIDTGAGPQVVTVQVRVADAVAGLKNFSIFVARKTTTGIPGIGSLSVGFYGDEMRWENGQMIPLSNGRCTDDGLHAVEPDIVNFANMSMPGCRISGTKNSGWYELKLVLPAHSAAGTYEIQSFNAMDYANNSSLFWYDKLVKLKMNKTFKNG